MRPQYDKHREILRYLKITIEYFNRNEKFLIDNDLSELCICSKFASYLERVLSISPFCDYEVDVEYNRGMNGKNDSIKVIDDENVRLDLVVHKRDHDIIFGYDNLFCIEFKKESNRKKYQSDCSRLDILVNNEYRFCYRAGFMILIKKDSGLSIAESYYNEIDF